VGDCHNGANDASFSQELVCDLIHQDLNSMLGDL